MSCPHCGYAGKPKEGPTILRVTIRPSITVIGQYPGLPKEEKTAYAVKECPHCFRSWEEQQLG